MLRLTALQMTRQARLASVYLAAPNTLVRTSRVAREAGSVIMGRSTSSSIGRLPSCDQIRSYSRRASSSVGCGDQWMPKLRRQSRPTAMARAFRPTLAYRSMRAHTTVARSTVLAARVESTFNRCSASASAPVRNSHSARCSSSAKVSSCRRSHESSGNRAAPAVK